MRHGSTVERTAGRGRSQVERLLRYLEADGQREVLTFIEGESGYPPFSADITSEAALVSAAQAVRALHDATAPLVRDLDSTWWHGWSPLTLTAPVAVECIGHGDLTPWNIVLRGTGVVALIDWDAAGPSSRAWDLCHAAIQLVPFHAPHESDGPNRWGWPEEPDRTRRLAMLCQAYGGEVSPTEIVDHAIERLVSIAGHIEREVRAGNPAFDRHRDEGHAAGYRGAAAYVIDHRSRWLQL